MKESHPSHEWEDVSYHGSPRYDCKFCGVPDHIEFGAARPCKGTNSWSMTNKFSEIMTSNQEWLTKIEPFVKPKMTVSEIKILHDILLDAGCTYEPILWFATQGHITVIDGILDASQKRKFEYQRMLKERQRFDYLHRIYGK